MLGSKRRKLGGPRLAAVVALTTAAVVAIVVGAARVHAASSVTLKVVYPRSSTTDNARMTFLTRVAKQFERANPGVKVQLNGIIAPENDYYTKIDLMQNSASTAPDVVYEDTFLVNSDVKAGYLKPIDSYVAKWPDWKQFFPTAQRAAKGLDGHIYGVQDGTDTRALWYNKELFKQAGLPTKWQPKTWNDVLTAARTIKAKVPDVVPINVYSGKPAGEASTMQGFEMLLYGTGSGLFNFKTKKWLVASKALEDSYGFLKTIYGEKLAEPLDTALNPNSGTLVAQQLLPQGKLAIDLDGFWIYNNWLPVAANPWAQWTTKMGFAAMPTQTGQAPGAVSMSGGWLYSISAKSKQADLAFKFIKFVTTEKNLAYYDRLNGQIAVRRDVARDPKYTKGLPPLNFFSNLVKVTHYRPAFADYPKVSNAIQATMESVMTGQKSPAQAVEDFAKQLKSAVGAANVERR